MQTGLCRGAVTRVRLPQRAGSGDTIRAGKHLAVACSRAQETDTWL